MIDFTVFFHCSSILISWSRAFFGGDYKSCRRKDIFRMSFTNILSMVFAFIPFEYFKSIFMQVTQTRAQNGLYMFPYVVGSLHICIHLRRCLRNRAKITWNEGDLLLPTHIDYEMIIKIRNIIETDGKSYLPWNSTKIVECVKHK